MCYVHSPVPTISRSQICSNPNSYCMPMYMVSRAQEHKRSHNGAHLKHTTEFCLVAMPIPAISTGNDDYQSCRSYSKKGN